MCLPHIIPTSESYATKIGKNREFRTISQLYVLILPEIFTVNFLSYNYETLSLTTATHIPAFVMDQETGRRFEYGP